MKWPQQSLCWLPVSGQLLTIGDWCAFRTRRSRKVSWLRYWSSIRDSFSIAHTLLPALKAVRSNFQALPWAASPSTPQILANMSPSSLVVALHRTARSCRSCSSLDCLGEVRWDQLFVVRFWQRSPRSSARFLIWWFDRSESESKYSFFASRSTFALKSRS